MLEILKVLFIILSLGIGWIFLMVFSFIISSFSHQDTQVTLSDELRWNRLAMNAEQIRLLGEIGKPDLTSGGYSDGKMELWGLYQEREEQLDMQFECDMEVLYG